VESAQALVEARGAVGVGFADVASDQSLGLEGQFDSGARGKEMSPTDFPLCVGGAPNGQELPGKRDFRRKAADGFSIGRFFVP
jgi:hypothetical protein